MQPYKPRQNTDVVSYDASTQSVAFNAQTTVVRIVATTNCNIRFGANPTATVANLYLPAGVVEYFRVTPGDKVAVIKFTGSSAGSLFVTEMTQ
jgi:hypothetical protein